MRRLVLRWVTLLVLVAAMGALFVRLGEWQVHRLEHRRQVNATVRTNLAKPVVPASDLMSTSHTVLDSEQWQRVTVTGSYDASHQFLALMRSAGDTNGSTVVTPLRAQGYTVLVDRGLLPKTAGVTDPGTIPAPPPGQVTITGYLRRDEMGKPQALTPVENRMQLISAGYLGKVLPYPIVDGYISMIQSTPADPAGLVATPTPELTEGPHLSYAIQWFAFTLIAVAGAAVLIRGDLRDRRRALAARASDGADAQPGDLEPASRKEE